ncbi:LTA synthase family protein [Serpentinicella alkaliphila]|uniref:Phosphoglycerol transferase MdoB-like AlkP superfamily enzyme n=1 Tax=Serpentinicella alkaliphila TaxID=1734049 RepID=A0A4R2U0D8_9FIRM|nr:LTA synthase family protein [Serpentinicella alkaliphila]QUH24810.1 LTA synthase family protein [Serpentinicella alkaliphila]TCQ03489.1 phosphoglycerol transferase MdoB-like AlkP superfamily enzyme [Serpentinicella alkaliphila]
MDLIESFNRKIFKDIILLTLLTSMKVFIFHHFIGIESNLLFINVKNLFIIFTLYSLGALLMEEKRKGAFICINFIVSLLLFIDAMYFSHFFTLIPFHSIFQARQLGPVSDSIFSLVKFKYLLFFVDFFLLWFIYRFKNNHVTQYKTVEKRFMLYVCVILIIVSGTMNESVISSANGIYTPHNLGIVNFHIYDVYNFFFRKPFDIARAEALIPVIADVEVPTKQGFGIGKGKNLIVIQAESIQNFVINREINGQVITPNLNKLINDSSIYFDRYYEQVGWGNTSDAEFISNNGYYPSTKIFSYKAYEGNEFYSLPIALKEKGYSTMAFHGNEAGFWNRNNIYEYQGIDRFISLEDFEADELIGIGLSDGSMFRQSMKFLKEQRKPFYSFFITLTSHHPFLMEEEYLKLNVGEQYKDTILDNYLQTVHYLDLQIGMFIEMLKEEGLYEDTIIVIYGDHQGLNMQNEEANQLMTDYLGEAYEEDEMFRVPLIVHMPNSGFEKRISVAAGQIDFFPTILNILGIDSDIRMNFGKDLLNTEDGFVAKQVKVTRGSFIDNEKIFVMSSDGIFENSRAWNIYTKEPVDLESCREGYERALLEVELSEYIMQNNLIPVVKEKGIGYLIEEFIE